MLDRSWVRGCVSVRVWVGWVWGFGLGTRLGVHLGLSVRWSEGGGEGGIEDKRRGRVREKAGKRLAHFSGEASGCVGARAC